MSNSTDKLRKKTPCKMCGSKLIDFHMQIVQMYDSGRDMLTVYCYCSRCGHIGPNITERFKDMDEARDRAFALWDDYSSN